MPDLNELIERFRNRDRQALSRLLTLAARGERAEAIQSAIRNSQTAIARGRVVAVTGSGGVGKSSLIGRMIDAIRGGGKTVAVLACDPESPLTGGALLGDRIRMPGRADDAGLFIRSLAATSGHQAIAENLDLMAEILLAFGFDVVLVETVGAGQGDTAVRDLADVLVLVLQPESGDDLQWEKAGLLEVADLIVINKADLPGADRLEAQLLRELNAPAGHEVSIFKTRATTGEGVPELWAAIETRPSSRPDPTNGRVRLLQLAQQRLTDQFHGRLEQILPLLDRWKRHELTDAEAADELLRMLAGS